MAMFNELTTNTPRSENHPIRAGGRDDQYEADSKCESQCQHGTGIGRYERQR